MSCRKRYVPETFDAWWYERTLSETPVWISAGWSPRIIIVLSSVKIILWGRPGNSSIHVTQRVFTAHLHQTSTHSPFICTVPFHNSTYCTGQIFTPRFHRCFKGNECASFMRQSKMTSLLDLGVNIYKIIHVYKRCWSILSGGEHVLKRLSFCKHGI
jgi:hypothetical protein